MRDPVQRKILISGPVTDTFQHLEHMDPADQTYDSAKRFPLMFDLGAHLHNRRLALLERQVRAMLRW